MSDGSAVSARRVYLGLGSNEGDRLANLRSAVELLRAAGLRVTASSSVYETEPVGEVTNQRDFYNAVVRAESALEPRALLAQCKAIERELGRTEGGVRGGPRPIDVDILLVGDLECADERLTLPHPQVTQRRFVLMPLLELDPELSLPGGASVAGCLAALPPGQRVRRVGALH